MAAGPKIDRRATRTRRLLHQALIQLILRKDYEAITVQDLLDEADIGRSTFYAHYAGKDDLLRRGFEQLRTELAAALAAHDGARDDEPSLAFSRPMLEHAERYKHVYRAMVGSRGGAIVLAEIRRVLLDLVDPHLDRAADSPIPRDLAGRFLVDAFQSVLIWWLERRPDLPAQSVDAMFRRLLRPAA